MQNIDLLPKIFFCGISSHSILNNEIFYHRFPESDFKLLVRQEIKYLTETEILEIFRYLQEKNGCNEAQGVDVFQVLKQVVRELLMIRDSQPECRYEELFRWRNLTRYIGEDLAISAFLADLTEREGVIWTDFEWKTVITHDNMQLKQILKRGMTDNHFHLFGSAPAFRLSWLNLMNFPANTRYVSALHKIDGTRRMQHSHYRRDFCEDSLELLHLKAALLRLVLFIYLRLAEVENWERVQALLSKVDEIKAYLTDPTSLILEKGKLQMEINRFRSAAAFRSPVNRIDYALYGCDRHSINHDFEGERRLLYQMLTGHVRNRKIPDILVNWFYAYLVIKGKFYEELVQINETIGFENFSIYTAHRYGFLLTEFDMKNVVQHAVIGSWEKGSLRGIELRITPAFSICHNRELIRKFDAYISEKVSSEQLKRIYYVFHFPKREDSLLKAKHGLVYNYRHRAYRERLHRQGEELILFRKTAPKEAARVLGIDACSMEIRCRPEVFAPVFRKLTAHVMPLPNIYRVKQWKITYHVGEEFLDLADGLRAIDEAILFLNMRNGDRLGHAMALGQDVCKWYTYKHNEISLSKEEYLDNVVWLYHKLLEFNIQSCETLKGYLRIQFEYYFYEIYGRFLDKRFIAAVSEHVNRIEHKHRDNIMDNEPYTFFDINVYYEAWKLRGDDPVLYEKGYYENRFRHLEPYLENSYSDPRVLRERNVKADFLYFYYHYSADVRHAGAQKLIIKVPDIYVEGVEKVQRAMQQRVADLGICIEANPSSNYLISTMQQYEDHPIRNLFNMGLTMDQNQTADSPQMHISINTDDKGVFQTSLENEFALMGCAMEQIKDENGNRIYQRQMVYEWLDRIREFGNQQSFYEES